MRPTNCPIRSLEIDFISIHEGVDTSTTKGRLVFGIFASIAEFERELIRDRVLGFDRHEVCPAPDESIRLSRAQQN